MDILAGRECDEEINRRPLHEPLLFFFPPLEPARKPLREPVVLLRCPSLHEEIGGTWSRRSSRADSRAELAVEWGVEQSERSGGSREVGGLGEDTCNWDWSISG